MMSRRPLCSLNCYPSSETVCELSTSNHLSFCIYHRDLNISKHSPSMFDHTSEIHRIMLEKIPAFLLAQKSTIRNLSLVIDNATFDVSSILQSLQLISCLHDISLTLPYATEATTLTPTALSSKEWLKILGTHQQHLRSLDLSFTPDCTVCCSSNPSSRMVFRNLTICIPGARFDTWDLRT